jgi:decaprenylphospho-beta-D-ribofuranose 2-oxidase
LLSLAVFKTIFIHNQTIKWYISELFYKYDRNKKITIAPPIATFSSYPASISTLVNDASWIDQTRVAAVYQPTNNSEVKQILAYAVNNHKQVSLSGVRHSMGGQALLTNGLQLDMTKMDSIRYNADKTATVGPGATWKQVQDVLNPYGRSVEVMQDSNIFTAGGSLSVNAHGKDPRFGSIISTVNYFKIITWDGKEMTCSRTQNADLFKSAAGGFGLFGVISEINLKTTENDNYKFSLKEVPTHDLLAHFENVWKEPETGLIEAHLSVDKDNFLTDSLLYVYTKDNSLTNQKTDTIGENNVALRKAVVDFSKTSNFGKLARWEIEKNISGAIKPKALTRNTAMAVPVRFLEHSDDTTTDILQEYFIPKDKFYEFISYYQTFVPSHKLNLVNVTVRKVSKDTEATVSYAKEDMYAFVVYYTIKKDSTDKKNLQSATQELINFLNTIHGTYYLCYGPYFTNEQLLQMYPEMRTEMKMKKIYVPQNVFANNWYNAIKE